MNPVMGAPLNHLVLVCRRRYASILLLTLALTLVAGACATATPARPDGLGDLFARPAAVRARQLAGDLYARARQARNAAKHAASATVRDAHLDRARLWLSAAEAEADRIQAERERAQLAAAWEAEMQAVAALRRQTLSVEAQAARRAAGDRNRKRWQAAHAQSAPWRRARREPPRRVVARHEVIDVLLERTSLWLALAAAARAPGMSDAAQRAAEAARVDVVRARALLDGGQGAADGGWQALRAADAALAHAEMAIGLLRMARGGDAGPVDACGFIEEAALRGLSPTGSAQGVSIRLSVLAEASATDLRIRHLRALLRLHPHGDVVLELAQAASTTDNARLRKLGRDVERALRTWRVGPSAPAAMPTRQLRVVERQHRAPPGQPATLTLRWPAYVASGEAGCQAGTLAAP